MQKRTSKKNAQLAHNRKEA